MIYAILALLGLMLVGWLFNRTPDAATRNWILIDGSNVMYWENEVPEVEPVRDAVELLIAKGYVPHVVFDANAGHLVSDRYQGPSFFAMALGLPEEQVTVMDKGAQADPFVLKMARRLNARVVSNDRFRDLAKRFPEVRQRKHLIHGGYHKHKLWLDFDGSRPRAHKGR